MAASDKGSAEAEQVALVPRLIPHRNYWAVAFEGVHWHFWLGHRYKRIGLGCLCGTLQVVMVYWEFRLKS
jgi:hypothetical protein